MRYMKLLQRGTLLNSTKAQTIVINNTYIISSSVFQNNLLILNLLSK
jgi:hypothetical protein